MRKNIVLLSCLAGAALVSGCLAPKTNPVPTAHIKLELMGQTADISDPKQLNVSGLTYKVESTNGCKAELSIASLTANNDSNVVSSSYTGLADVINANGNQVNTAFKNGADVAGKFLGSTIGAAK